MGGFLEKFRASSRSAQRRLRAREAASADQGHVPESTMQQPAGQPEVRKGDKSRHVLPFICHAKASATPAEDSELLVLGRHERLDAEDADGDPISHTEALEWLGRGGYIRYALVEELQPDDGRLSFRVLLLTSWRNGYHPFSLNLRGDSTFRDFHQLLKMLRTVFAYPGSIEVRQEKAPKKRKGAWTRTSPVARGRQSDA